VIAVTPTPIEHQIHPNRVRRGYRSHCPGATSLLGSNSRLVRQLHDFLSHPVRSRHAAIVVSSSSPYPLHVVSARRAEPLGLSRVSSAQLSERGTTIRQPGQLGNARGLGICAGLSCPQLIGTLSAHEEGLPLSALTKATNKLNGEREHCCMRTFSRSSAAGSCKPGVPQPNLKGPRGTSESKWLLTESSHPCTQPLPSLAVVGKMDMTGRVQPDGLHSRVPHAIR
jgi:hypothetical protein